MSDAHVPRFTAITGFAAFALYVVSAILIVDVPGIDATPHNFAAYVAAHGTPFLLEVVVWGLASCAVVAFAVGLWAVLRRAEGEPGVFAMLFLAGTLLTQAIVLGGFPGLLVLGYRAGSLTPAEVRLLGDLTFLGVALSAFPTALTMAAYAALALRTAAFPSWTAWLALLVGALHVIAGASFARTGLFSPSGIGVYLAPPAFFVWTLAVSVALLRARGPMLPATAASPGPRASAGGRDATGGS